MKNRILSVITCVFGLAILVACLTVKPAASAQILLAKESGVSVPAFGRTKVYAEVPGYSVAVEIETMRAKGWQGFGKFRVACLRISINGQAIFVPRSCYSDLVELHSARLEVSNKKATLFLEGADASEGYTAIIAVKGAKVVSRKLVGLGALMEKTDYYEVVLE